MKSVRIKWELVVSIASLIISVAAFFYTYKAGRNCDRQITELSSLFDEVRQDLTKPKLSYSVFETMQSRLRFKIDKLNTSGCGWNDTLNTQRQLIIDELWVVMDKIIREGGKSISDEDRKVIIGILDTLDLFCSISPVSCRGRDKRDMDRLRIIYGNFLN